MTGQGQNNATMKTMNPHIQAAIAIAILLAVFYAWHLFKVNKKPATCPEKIIKKTFKQDPVKYRLELWKMGQEIGKIPHYAVMPEDKQEYYGEIRRYQDEYLLRISTKGKLETRKARFQATAHSRYPKKP